MKALLKKVISKIPLLVLLAAILLIIGIVIDTAIFSWLNWHYDSKLKTLTFEKSTSVVEYTVTDITPYHFSNGATEFQVSFGVPTDSLSNFDIIVPDIDNIQKGSIWEVKETTYSCNPRFNDSDSLLKRDFQLEHEALTDKDIKQFQDKARSDYKNYLDSRKSSDIFGDVLFTVLVLLSLYIIPILLCHDKTEENNEP